MYIFFNEIQFIFLIQLFLCDTLCVLMIQFRFCHLPKKREIVKLHSIFLTISPFMFWDDSKTFSKSVLSLLILAKKQNFRIAKCKYLRTITFNI